MNLLVLLFVLSPDPVVISALGALDEPNEYKVEQTDSGQSVKDRFYAVGEMQQDFRKDGAQVLKE